MKFLCPSSRLCKKLAAIHLPSRSFGQPVAQTHPHLLAEGEVTPGITKAEFRLRRETLLKAACKQFCSSKYEHLLIFPSAPVSYMAYNIPYPFRQNTEFLYLSGFQEPDSVLLLHVSEKNNINSKFKSVLFVPKKDPHQELWNGPRSGTEGALQLTGVDETYNVENLQDYLLKFCKNISDFVLWYNFEKPPHWQLHSGVIRDFIGQGQHKHLVTPKSLTQLQRLIKSPAELELMKKTVDIASEAFKEVIRFSYPGVSESYLYAKMDFECRIRDAEMLAYPPVVAGGNRANIIHYIKNNQIVHGGELVLMDAGCEFHGYSSDITRTWPVSGKFSAAQRHLYLAILKVQESCISMCTKKFTLNEIYYEMLNLLGQELQSLGIIPDKDMNEKDLHNVTKDFCPHHVSHYLGMDVHDTSDMPRDLKMKPGMIVTVEPGVYIPQDREDVPEEFRGIGIRIEDDVLITSNQPIVLSASCPKHPDDIEALMCR